MVDVIVVSKPSTSISRSLGNRGCRTAPGRGGQER